MPRKSQKAKLILSEEKWEQLQKIAQSRKAPLSGSAAGQNFIAIFRRSADYRYRKDGTYQQTDDLQMDR